MREAIIRLNNKKDDAELCIKQKREDYIQNAFKRGTGKNFLMIFLSKISMRKQT